MIDVLLAEDHLLIRAGLRALLEKAGDIQVVGEAADGHTAVTLVAQHRPTILLMDIMLPRLNGLQAVEQVRALNLPTRILLLSMYSDVGLVQQALRCGVQGYLLKSDLSEELLAALRALARGETYFSAPIAALLAAKAHHPRLAADPADPLAVLSPREKEILQLIAEAHTSAEIAALLVISEKTVERHRAALMEKLGTHNLAGLVRLAVRYGLVPH